MTEIEELVIQDVIEASEEDMVNIKNRNFRGFENLTLIVQIISIVIQVMPILIEWWKSRSYIVRPFSKYFIKRRLNKFIKEKGYENMPVDKLTESIYNRLDQNA